MWGDMDRRSRVAGQDVVGCGLSCHPSTAVARSDAAALHGCPEGDVLHWGDAVDQAPACVEAVEAVRPQWPVRFVRGGGFKEESFEVRGGHQWLFSAGASYAAVRLQRPSLRRAPDGKGSQPSPEGLIRTSPNLRSSRAPVQRTEDGPGLFDESPAVRRIGKHYELLGELYSLSTFRN
jgi:hypothetical protein